MPADDNLSVEIEPLLTQYGALRQEVTGFVQSLVNLGTLAFVGISVAFTFSTQFTLLPLKVLLPTTILLLVFWVITHLYSLYYEAAHMSILERRINRASGLAVMEYDSIWSAIRKKRVTTVTEKGKLQLSVESQLDLGMSNPPFLVLSAVIFIWFIGILGFAIWDGMSAVFALAGPLPIWGVYGVTTIYGIIHIGLSIVGALLWFFWLPRNLRYWLNVWEQWYHLEE